MINVCGIIALAFFAISCGKGFKETEPQMGRQSEPHSGDFNRIEVREEYLRLANEHRSRHGLTPLLHHYAIDDNAYIHSRGMSMRTRPYGNAGLDQRCRRIKSRLGTGKDCEEIISQGQRTPAEALKNWLKSPDAKKLIEDPRFSYSGLGVHQDKNGVIYWTQIFLEI
jgi:uncharacterized protein YkwD